MRYVKKLGLAAFAVVALMAFAGAGTAWATEATCSKGVMCQNGAAFEATSTHSVFTGAVELTCEHSLIKGSQGTTGSSTETVKMALISISLTQCENGWEVTVIDHGHLTLHTDANDSAGTSGNGTVTSEGALITAENKSLGGLHCIFSTATATDIGTLDGSTTTGKTATLTIEGTIARTGGRSGAFCGASAKWEGDYTILAPDFYDIH